MSVVTKRHRKWLMRRAIQASPFEACGFIFDDGSLIEMRNVSLNPYIGFQMSRDDMMNRVGEEGYSRIGAIWHTHPGGTCYPSKVDQDALFSGAIQKNWEYLIVTKDSVSSYSTKTLVVQDDSFWERFVA